MSEKTFKEKTKEETLTALPEGGCCVFAFLSAVCKTAGSIERASKRTNLCVQLEGYGEAIKIVELFKSVYPAEFEIVTEHAKAGVKAGKLICCVRVPAGFTKQVLADLELMSVTDDGFEGFTEGIPSKFTSKACCAENYFKGLYLTCGSCYAPSLTDTGKSGYHFELQFDDEALANDAYALMRNFGVDAKTSERGAHTLVYVKDKDEIMKLLGVMGLYDSALTLQNVIDERETANSINRTTICEAANLDKTYAAATDQLLSIGMIEERYGLDSLPAELRETADVRMEYKQASMSELAGILGVTKSCINHRLRKLKEIAERGENGSED